MWNVDRLLEIFLPIVTAAAGYYAGRRIGERQGRLEATPARLRRHTDFRSEHLGGARELVVYLPPGYDARPRQRYPILYLHDGQNLFDPATSFIPGQHWQVAETTTALIEAGSISPLIIVGVYHAGTGRIDEYTPTRDATRQAGGRADLHARMMIEELKPFIDARYRTLDGPASTGLGGSSLGGLATLYLGLKHPEVFGRLAVISPSIWWDDRYILRMLQELRQKPAARIWLDMGTAESPGALHDCRKLHHALLEKGWRHDVDLAYLEVEGAPHSELAWRQRFDQVLRFLFPPR